MGSIVAVAVLGSSLIGLAPADARKKHKQPRSPPVITVSASQSTSTEDELVTVTATCPAGLLAVGGGFLAPPIFAPLNEGGGADDYNLVYESRRSGDSTWQVSAARFDTAGPGPDLPVTASVDCRSAKLGIKKRAKGRAAVAKKKTKKKLRITEVSASSATPPTTFSQATATSRCPGRMRALGGGFSSAPRPMIADLAEQLVSADYRSSPTTWTAAITNIGTAGRTVTSYAYCAARLKIVESSVDTILPRVGQPTADSGSATTPPCPKRTALLGGGFSNSPATVTGGIAILTASNPANGDWQVGAWNYGIGQGTIGSRAYCA